MSAGRVVLTPALRAPVTDMDTAKAFIRELQRLNLDHHFDDGAMVCLFENGVVARLDAVFIDRQVANCYDAWQRDGRDLMEDCPIGYLLEISREAGTI